jgi:fructose-1,6-bisphosphatase/inositol monophosphatase family enzyme
MPLDAPEQIVQRLIEFQSLVREQIIRSRLAGDLHGVSRSSAADTIYNLDTQVDPVMEDFFQQWGRLTPLVLVAEGLQDEHGHEGAVTFPHGTPESAATLRIIVDPVDGTRGMMYDKRPAWSLAAVAPNRGPDTRLRDVEVAVMTELPTSKMGFADVLWAIKGGGAVGQRVDLRSGAKASLELQPSGADHIRHSFATISNFFPGTKALAGEIMDLIAQRLLDPADVGKAMVFDDQYISTGGQFYELIVGHDRFNADLRPVIYDILRQAPGLCCHPYDCAALLIAEEAGVVVSDQHDQPLDAPLDTVSPIAWIGYANQRLREHMAPIVLEALKNCRERR